MQDFDFEDASEFTYIVSEDTVNNIVGMTREENDMARYLAKFFTLKVDDVLFTEGFNDISPLGLSLFQNFSISLDGRVAMITHSPIGLEDATLDNLSVIANGVVQISGSGTRLLTEWWEKKNGEEVFFIHLDSRVLCMFFKNGKWVMSGCNQFLAEGAELVGDTLFIRENLQIPLEIVGEEFKVQVVEHHNFDTPIPPSVEGIVCVIDHRHYRLKYEHTLDLEVEEGRALSATRKKIFEVSPQLKGIVEFTLDGKPVRSRLDKKRADTNAKILKIQKLPTLHDLQDLLSIIATTEDVKLCFRDQWVGYRSFSCYTDQYIPFAKNVLWQIVTPDQQNDIRNFKTNINVPPFDYVNDTTGYFEYKKYINKLKRSGVDFTLRDVRKNLIAYGFVPIYGHWKVVKNYDKYLLQLTDAVHIPTMQIPFEGLKSFQGMGMNKPLKLSPGVYDCIEKVYQVMVGMNAVISSWSQTTFDDAFRKVFTQLNWKPGSDELIWATQHICDEIVGHIIDEDGLYKSLRSNGVYMARKIYDEIMKGLFAQNLICHKENHIVVCYDQNNPQVDQLGDLYKRHLEGKDRLVVAKVRGVIKFSYVGKWKSVDTPVDIMKHVLMNNFPQEFIEKYDVPGFGENIVVANDTTATEVIAPKPEYTEEYTKIYEKEEKEYQQKYVDTRYTVHEEDNSDGCDFSSRDQMLAYARENSDGKIYPNSGKVQIIR